MTDPSYTSEDKSYGISGECVEHQPGKSKGGILSVPHMTSTGQGRSLNKQDGEGTQNPRHRTGRKELSSFKDLQKNSGWLHWKKGTLLGIVTLALSINKMIKGWGEGSVGEALAFQAQGPEFESPEPISGGMIL